MIRRRFTAAPVLSLTICVAIGIVWWSTLTPVAFEFAYAGKVWRFGLVDGGLLVDNKPQRQLDDAAVEQIWAEERRLEVGYAHALDAEDAEAEDRYHRVLSFRKRFRASPVSPAVSYHVPCGAIFLAGGVLVVIGYYPNVRSRRRLLSGRCSVCGYDLRASTDRCPECGTPIPVTMNA